MKFKVYMKKCLELGVSMILVDDIEIEEVGMWFIEWIGFLGGFCGFVIIRYFIKYFL